MVEKLCTPSDDDHNEHKKLQLRELAALNGTLKDITACFVCGDEGHDAEHCPKKVRTCALCIVLPDLCGISLALLYSTSCVVMLLPATTCAVPGSTVHVNAEAIHSSFVVMLSDVVAIAITFAAHGTYICTA
jgi:hypothetical protein